MIQCILKELEGVRHSLLTHIYGRDIDEFWHAPRQENCGVTTIEVKGGECHVLKESEIFYNKDGE